MTVDVAATQTAIADAARGHHHDAKPHCVADAAADRGSDRGSDDRGSDDRGSNRGSNRGSDRDPRRATPSTPPFLGRQLFALLVLVLAA